MANAAGEETTKTTEGEVEKPPATKPEPGSKEAPAKAKETPAADPKATAAGTKQGDAGGGKEAAKAHALKDDEDIPEDAELVTMTSTALKKRLARATNAELKERFGTTDTDAIKKKLARADELEKAEEERRVAALDKDAKQLEAQKKAEARAEKAEADLKEARNERIVDKEEGRLKEIAGEHIKMKFWKHVAKDFAEHLRDNLTKEEIVKLKDKEIDKWFTSYVKDNPEYAKQAAAAADADDKAGVKKVTLDNGVKGEERPSGAGAPNMAAKTYKTGQPNSMSSQEARQAAAKEGYKW